MVAYIFVSATGHCSYLTWASSCMRNPIQIQIQKPGVGNPHVELLSEIPRIYSRITMDYYGLLCCEVWMSIQTLSKAPRISGASSLRALPVRTWSLDRLCVDGCDDLTWNFCLIPSEDPTHVIQVRAKRTDILTPSSLTCCSERQSRL